MEIHSISNKDRIYGAILVRVSTLKQYQEGSSLEDQLAQCKHFASARNIPLSGKEFNLVISGYKAEQSQLDEAYEYCKDPKNRIKYLIFKSIDRVSRGGSYAYSYLKAKLAEYGVQLLDTYGVIQHRLTHLNI
jgi:DNA invertase Pin-like site-specific DNA recombinase